MFAVAAFAASAAGVPLIASHSRKFRAGKQFPIRHTAIFG
jgi:hypothetical protein